MRTKYVYYKGCNTICNAYFFEKDKEIGKIHIRIENNTIDLWNFEIVEEYRNCGYGTKVLKKIIRKFNYRPLWLYVFKYNYLAIHLYKKMGFKVIGEEKNTFSMQREIDNTEG